ncbi:MAG TPA: Yip1 family protein [Gemmatimonadales bacterium]|nr:Yip1 family protein [Gemmatimonadales bacterium]
MALMDRVKKVLLQPKEEWPVIDAEPTSIGALYTGYIMPLAAIGPIAQLVGFSVFGMRIPFTGVTYRVPISNGIKTVVIEYVLGLIGPFVLALIIDALAPTFSGQKNQIQALKAAAYSSTAAWVAGIFGLIPALSILGILGLYSLFLLYLGLPIVMKAPQDKAMGYTVVVIICAIVLYFLTGWIVARFAWQPAMGVPGL